MTVIDLFSGARGWEVASDVDALGIEWDADACATSEAAGFRTVQDDIAELEPLDFAPIEGLIASPPCQAYSTAGKGKGKRDQQHVVACAHELAAGSDTRAQHLAACEDPRSLLTVEPLRWALTLRPRWIACEQVPAVLPLWSLFAELLSVHGYHTAVGVLTAEQYGVPQTRKRAFLIASLDGPVDLPAPTHQRYKKGEPAQHRDGLLPWVSMAEALGWGATERPAPTVTSGGTATGGAEPFARGGREALLRARDDREWAYRSTTMPNSARASLEDAAPTIAFGHDAASACWVLNTNRDQRPDGTRQQIDCGRRTPTVTAKSGGQWVFDRPAPTIVTTRRSKDGILVGRQLPPGEGVNVGGWGYERPSTTVNCDPRISRPGRHDPAESGSQQRDAIRVTAEQASVLQSFPADYPWQGTKTAKFRQIGNAVPPLLGAAVLDAARAPTQRTA